MEPCWKKFLMAFGSVLDKCSQEDIRKAWSTLRARTAFYAIKVLPGVAEELKLEYDTKEFLNIDHVFRDSSNVPRVFIESENNAARAEEEIWKLCTVSCPLRVLITVVEWDPTPGVWISPPSQRNALLPKWGVIATAHHTVLPNRGLLALLVGELRDLRFRFYAHHFDSEARTWPLDGIYQRNLSGPNLKGEPLAGWPS